MKVKFNLAPDVPNKNGTIYPREELKKAIEKYNNEDVKTGRALGLNHQPTEYVFPLSDASFKVKNIEFSESENYYVADIEILPTPKGKELEGILKKIDEGDYRIVTYSMGTVENGVIKDMQIVSVGIEPKENCA